MNGTVTVSLELELGWGMHDLDEYGHLSPDAQAERDTFNEFLELCDICQIPVTVDVVGHLVQEGCEGVHDGSYPDGWWAADPASDWKQDPEFYAPDMVEAVHDSAVDHEIATHTYSHVLCDEVPNITLEHELETVQDVHERAGLAAPKSFVPPRHRSPAVEPLRNAGIETIRRAIPDYGSTKRNRIETFHWLWAREHPICNLEITDGMVETFCTPHPSLTSTMLPSGQSPPHSVFRAVPRRIRQRRHREYLVSSIDRAAATESHLHLWTHVYNLAGSGQWLPVKAGLEHLADRRDGGAVDIKRMCDLPNLISA